MGTNYYLRTQPACACCGREYEPIHIGKSSGGWCFTLHVIPENAINSLDDWRKLWNTPGAKILDEYDRQIPIEEMEEVITQRSWNAGGLRRHPIDGRYCIGHGEGTWDCCPGEFS